MHINKYKTAFGGYYSLAHPDCCSGSDIEEFILEEFLGLTNVSILHWDDILKYVRDILITVHNITLERLEAVFYDRIGLERFFMSHLQDLGLVTEYGSLFAELTRRGEELMEVLNELYGESK